MSEAYEGLGSAEESGSDGEYWHDCWKCGGEGVSHHDCGEDTCCCFMPEDNVRCDICKGKGGWLSDSLPED